MNDDFIFYCTIYSITQLQYNTNNTCCVSKTKSVLKCNIFQRILHI